MNYPTASGRGICTIPHVIARIPAPQLRGGGRSHRYARSDEAMTISVSASNEIASPAFLRGRNDNKNKS